MANLNELDILSSLHKKVHILERYVKQLHFYFYLFTPPSFLVGLYFSLQQQEFTVQRFLVISLVSLPFLALVIWLGKKYIHLLYGKHLKQLKEMLSELNPEASAE